MLTVTLPLAEGAGVIGCQEPSIVGFCDRYCWLVQCLFLCERHCLLVQRRFLLCVVVVLFCFLFSVTVIACLSNVCVFCDRHCLLVEALSSMCLFP